MKFEIKLDGEGLALILPTGRTIRVSCTQQGIDAIYRILLDAENYNGSPRKRYIGAFPTQAEVDEWLADKRKRDQERWLAKGINPDAIKIEL